MEKSLDFGFVFKTHETKHKSRPTQFMSIAGGVQKRRESNLKYRKSCRLTEFDNVRDLSASDSPKAQVKPMTEAELKIEHRRQQLEKWKEEKEAKKKQQAMMKKKPFVAGVVHAPLKFVPPPPPKPMPSNSGRVTRSQSAKLQTKKDVKESKASSFAPKSSTTFKPPQIKTTSTLPVFPSTKSRQKPNTKVNVTFEPVVPKKNNTKENEKVTRSTRNNTNDKNKAKPRPSPKKAKKSTKVAESSSESSKEVPPQEKPKKRATRQSSTHNFIVETINQSPVLQTRTPRKSILNTTTESQESIVLPSRKTPRKSIVAENNSPKNSPKPKTPKNKPIPKSESNSEEKLRSPKEVGPMTPEQISEVAKQISPCVTMSRGKDNARREMKKKLEQGLLDEDASDMASVEHFRRQLDSEIRRMTLLADQWDEVYDQTALPEFVQELVLTATGQARLLMSQKMQQFAGLVGRCAARDASTGLVTPADLAGFWDMLFIQIENIDVRFKQLETLRARDWCEEQPVAAKKKPAPRANKKTKPAPGNSKIREMIAAARKAKKDQESGTDSSVASSLQSQASDSDASSAGKSQQAGESQKTGESQGEETEKTFEAGFFCVKSPVRSPAPRTPVRKHSLLKCVLSSEARKASASKNSPASFAMLRASLLGKSVDIEGVAPLEQTPKNLSKINLDATPARSILKSTQKARKSAKKSIKTVLFDHSDNEHSLQETAKDFVLLEITPTKDVDSGVSMEVDTENKENDRSRSKSRLTRQEALDYSPVQTRARRKSLQTPKENKEVLLEEDRNTPRRVSRRKKSLNEKEDLIDFNTPKEPVRRTRRQRKSEV